MFEITGLEELEKQLSQLERNAKRFDGEHTVSFDDLFTPSFMLKYTSFDSIDEFVESSGFDFQNQEENDESSLDEFVRENTSFDDWHSMQEKAAELWALKRLGL